jgi:hypothetical protein
MIQVFKTLPPPGPLLLIKTKNAFTILYFFVSILLLYFQCVHLKSVFHLKREIYVSAFLCPKINLFIAFLFELWDSVFTLFSNSLKITSQICFLHDQLQTNFLICDCHLDQFFVRFCHSKKSFIFFVVLCVIVTRFVQVDQFHKNCSEKKNNRWRWKKIVAWKIQCPPHLAYLTRFQDVSLSFFQSF